MGNAVRTIINTIIKNVKVLNNKIVNTIIKT